MSALRDQVFAAREGIEKRCVRDELGAMSADTILAATIAFACENARFPSNGWVGPRFDDAAIAEAAKELLADYRWLRTDEDFARALDALDLVPA